jgi:hypothetical protein
MLGKIAITTLVDMMEHHRNEFVVIMAGYPKEMDELLNSNPGLMYASFGFSLTLIRICFNEVYFKLDMMLLQ